MKETEILIRQWDKSDFNQIIYILKESWDKAYSSFIPEEDLVFYLDKTYNIKELEKLYNDENIICYSAVVDNQTVGWLKLTINRKENRFYLSSIYVLPEYQNLKIGKRFIDTAFSKAKKKGFSEIWIGVMENNSNVLRWYENLGFIFTESLPFTMGKTTVAHKIGVREL
ncbi:MAG: GNAT family N-acetyltransferase [Bacteroidetes bacterium]|nr:GNAT family N-acetyltransferase [Bacteroidota bacterium]